MKVLAIDSSGIVASVAIVEDETLISEYTTNYKKTHSQTLMPMIERMNRDIELDLTTLDGIAVAAGPGSFTGLRIGAATAKGLALALDKPIISVPTLDALAYNIFNENSLVCPIMDARRSQVYTALYEYDKGSLVRLTEHKAVPIEGIIEAINETQRSVIFIGDGVPVFKELLEAQCKTTLYFAPSHLNRQRAGAVGSLAITFAKEDYQTATEFKPFYLRKSQAEREYEKKANTR